LHFGNISDIFRVSDIFKLTFDFHVAGVAVPCQALIQLTNYHVTGAGHDFLISLCNVEQTDRETFLFNI